MKKTILSEEDVKHIVNLARLILTAEEVKKYQKQLTSIFDYIDQIGEMKTKNIKETSHPSDSVTNIFREDVINTAHMLTQEVALSNASSKKNGYFVVKAIFQNE